ncbi:hypothetical protein [Mycobacterium sp. shizuoka-1]|uniref:hypothetical protein n=1 Tax=Mycobacterium sp. shizuoka-1 TaxID=2039281 RepID=UPI000C060742|nr:hypothetical protein [Mycobacterium sp. shizuoka-1]GAY15539.1 hypothetical protein MSZK_22650 [Mycobacterium sp. shizuoka-1]
MSLIYRAIWQDQDLSDVCDLAAETFSRWVTSKWRSIVVPENGVAYGVDKQGAEQVELEVRTSGASDPDTGISCIYRADLIETRSGNSRWHTTLRSWEASEPDKDALERWIWVDVEVVGDVDIARLASAAPRLVNDLLGRGGSPTVDGDLLKPLNAEITGFAAGEQLAETISRPDRTLPVIVVNDDVQSRCKAADHDLYLPDVVEAVRRATAGIAVVYTIDNEAADGVIDALGRSHGVWDGAMRVYLTDVDPAASGNAWRHRYFTANRYAGSKTTARQAVGRLLGPVSAVRRPPQSYPAAKRLLEQVGTSGDHELLLELADTQLREADSAIAELREQIRDRDESIEGLALDLGVAAEERAYALRQIEELERHVQSLQGQLKAPDEFYALERDQQPPATAASLSHAAELAREYLSDRLVIPPAALHDLDQLDAAPTSAAWGQTSWEGFLALHAYASDRAAGWDGGGFWEWCKHSGNLRAWRATDKKLAMVESESVNNSPKLRRTREFPVSVDVQPTGKIFMQAHLKIATGGGNLAPRIYFHFDDGHCRTHVGFFGPHKLLPNTKT